MKNNNKRASILFLVAGICFIVSAIFSKNYYLVPIGCSQIVLSVIYKKRQ